MQDLQSFLDFENENGKGQKKYLKALNVEEEEVLYEDDFVKVTNSKVIIPSYYFPIPFSKEIEIKDIKNAEFAKNLSLFDMKDWGLSTNNVWWAMNFKKILGDRCAVILDTGGSIKSGFCPAAGREDATARVHGIIEELIRAVQAQN